MIVSNKITNQLHYISFFSTKTSYIALYRYPSFAYVELGTSIPNSINWSIKVDTVFLDTPDSSYISFFVKTIWCIIAGIILYTALLFNVFILSISLL